MRRLHSISFLISLAGNKELICAELVLSFNFFDFIFDLLHHSYDTCLDNMQRKRGAPGLYACHGYGTQRWMVKSDGQLRTKSSTTCIGIAASAGASLSTHGDSSVSFMARFSIKKAIHSASQ